MGALAGLLVEAGHTVTGTDEKLYPPMSDQLTNLGIKPFEGYDAKNISDTNPELVIIGNVIRRENIEAQEVMRLGIPYKSMPDALSELFLKMRTSIVIAGTHGKTTSSTLAAWLLESSGEKPGFLIGGVGLNLNRSYSLGKGPFFVVEGDEYDTAFFDKGPKFLHYRPKALVLTSIEFDHADIYKNLEEIIESFRRLIKIVPPDGLIVASASDPNVMALTREAKCRVVTYGLENGDYHPSNIINTPCGINFDLANTSFTLPMWGKHNIENTTGILATLIEAGISKEILSKGLTKFKGIKRRQEIIETVNGITVIDDFAHHPTAVEKTIESMRQRFPGQRLWAIFEPRSNTSRRNIFQDEFVSAFSNADRVIIASPYKMESIDSSERFDSEKVASAIMKRGVDAHYVRDTEHIIEFVMRQVASKDIILVMSNGDFDGLIPKLITSLKRRRLANQ